MTIFESVAVSTRSRGATTVGIWGTSPDVNQTERDQVNPKSKGRPASCCFIPFRLRVISITKDWRLLKQTHREEKGQRTFAGGVFSYFLKLLPHLVEVMSALSLSEFLLSSSSAFSLELKIGKDARTLIKPPSFRGIRIKSCLIGGGWKGNSPFFLQNNTPGKGNRIGN